MPRFARPKRITIGAHRWPLANAPVHHAQTLLDGYTLAQRLLDRKTTPAPALILLDLHAHEPGFPELAAPQLAAVLAQQMHAGTLHPAWLIGLVTPPAPDLDAEAYLAGCHVILHRPLRTRVTALLDQLARCPASLPPSDPATRAYQQAAARVLPAVRVAQIPLWTATEARLLLGWLTRYPLTDALRARATSAEMKRILRTLGGAKAARRRLQSLVDAWDERFPLEADVLQFFLDGWERKEIVRFFVDQQLYEDSRVYAVINRLPERIAQEFRLAQSRGAWEET
ncbi:MAG TPA: hypothetical protein VFZ66_27370 [Herpetosiphonaceae bacterium]